MQISYNVEAFRRNPKLGVGLGAIVLLIGAFGIVHAYSSLKTLPSVPQEMTIEEAAPVVGVLNKADSARPAWIRNKGLDVPISNYPLMEISVGEGPDDAKAEL